MMNLDSIDAIYKMAMRTMKIIFGTCYILHVLWKLYAYLYDATFPYKVNLPGPLVTILSVVVLSFLFFVLVEMQDACDSLEDVDDDVPCQGRGKRRTGNPWMISNIPTDSIEFIENRFDHHSD